jgi:hypothetical protein
MSSHPVPGAEGPPVVVAQPRGRDDAPEDVLPALVEERASGVERYIAYSAVAEGESVEDYWLSVDLSVVVSRELWR